MKKLIISILILTSLYCTDENSRRKTRSINSDMVSKVFFQYGIKSTDLTTDSFDGVNKSCHVIRNSGNYYVANQLDGAPAANEFSLILITANNVKLNLNGSNISQASDNKSTKISGITIGVDKAPVNNITIYNGTINNLSGYGINIIDGCRHIVLNNLLINNCTLGSINIAGTTGIKNVEINSCQLTSTPGTTGVNAISLTASLVTGLKIVDCSLNGNTPTIDTLNAYGAYIDKCQDVRVENCQISSITNADKTGKGSAIGLYLNESNNVLATNVKINSIITSGASGDTYGIQLNNVSNATIKHSQVMGLQAVQGDCYAIAVTGDSSKSNSFINCSASGNSSNKSNCYGFALLAGSSNILENCKALSNEVTGSKAKGTTSGIYVSNSARNRFTNCESNSNRTDQQTVNSYGFVITGANSTGNTIINCITNGNGNDNSATANDINWQVAGFAILDQASYTSIVKSTSQSNYAINGIVSGILVDGTANSKIAGTLVENCTIINNFVSKNGNLYGLNDTSNKSSLTLKSNVFFNNGVSKVLPVTAAPKFKIVDKSAVKNGVGGQNLYLDFGGFNQDPTNILIETNRSNFKTVDLETRAWTNVLVVSDN